MYVNVCEHQNVPVSIISPRLADDIKAELIFLNPGLKNMKESLLRAFLFFSFGFS